MKTSWALLIVLSAVLAGCSSPGASNPLVLAPTRQDWQAAFSKLSPVEQALITDKPLVVSTVDAPVDGAIYAIINGKESSQLVEAERIDVAAVCDSFNLLLGQRAKGQWQLVSARSYDDIMAPAGIQTHRIDLNWCFRSSTGKAIPVSATAFGPGVKIIWGGIATGYCGRGQPGTRTGISGVGNPTREIIDRGIALYCRAPEEVARIFQIRR